MSRFSGALDLRAYDVGEWVLLESFRYRSKSGLAYTAPRWFISDLASIPWIVQPLFNSIEHRPAGVIHDWLYCSQIVPREEADALFYEMVMELGVGKIRAGMMLSGLRAGGWYRWGQCVGGPKREDFAWEFMTEKERREAEGMLNLSIITA